MYYIQKIMVKLGINLKLIKENIMKSKMFVEVNSTIIKGGNSVNGLLYSEDNGKTWKERDIIINNNQ